MGKPSKRSGKHKQIEALVKKARTLAEGVYGEDGAAVIKDAAQNAAAAAEARDPAAEDREMAALRRAHRLIYEAVKLDPELTLKLVDA